MSRIKEWFSNFIWGCIFVVCALIGRYFMEMMLRSMEREEEMKDDSSTDNLPADSAKLFCIGLFYSFPAVTNVTSFIK